MTESHQYHQLLLDTSKQNKNDYFPTQQLQSLDFFSKPTTKLEQIENLILTPESNITTHTNQIPTTSSTNLSFNTIKHSSNNNLLLDNHTDNNKIISLQRSISDKLRNSFKSNTNKINSNNNNNNNNNKTLANNNQVAIKSNFNPPLLTLTRKWHSERYKNNKIQVNNHVLMNNRNSNVENCSNRSSLATNTNTNKLSFKFSSQINKKLQQYTNNTKITLCNNYAHNSNNNSIGRKIQCQHSSHVKQAKSLEIQSKNKTLLLGNPNKSSNLLKSDNNNKTYLFNKFSSNISKDNSDSGKCSKNNACCQKLNNKSINNINGFSETSKKSISYLCNNKSLSNNNNNNNNDTRKLILLNYQNKKSKNTSKNNVFIKEDKNFSDDEHHILNESTSSSSSSSSSFDTDFDNEDETDYINTRRRNLVQEEDEESETDVDDDYDNRFEDFTINKRLTRSHSFSIGDKNNIIKPDSAALLLFDKPTSSKESDYYYFYKTAQNSSNHDNENLLLYERVTKFKYECEICYEKVYLNERLCCKFRACNNCINLYIQSKIKNSCGILVKIECPNTKCTNLIHRDEICERMSHYDKTSLKNYLKYLLEANKDSNSKTCPRCSHIMKLDDYQLKDETSLEKKSKSTNKKKVLNTTAALTKVQCIECQLIWCFQCHAPWHDAITCNEFRKGDRMLKYWAKEVHYGQQNAQLCPKCKIYIQRTKGCDHMVCTYCQTEFCYKCGGRFRRFKFIGDHYSKLSVLGCKYRFYPEKPTKRKLIRSSLLGVKILAAPIVASVCLVVGIGALAVGCVALPIYGSYKIVDRFRVKHSNRSVIENDINKNSIRLIKVSEIGDNSLFQSFDDQTVGILHKYKLVENGISNQTNSNSTAITSNYLSNDNGSNLLNLVPREASRNQKLINMINNDIDKFKKNESSII